MTLLQLRYFCNAARYHSITQAARTLYVTQPAVSIAIRELEKEYGIHLFAHTGSGLTLTEEGEQFYLKASRILEACDELAEEYSDRNKRTHRFRMGIPPLLGSVFFPEMLDAFHEEYPDTWIELQEFGSARACRLIQDDVLDIALVNMEMPNIDKYNSLELLQDPLYFCVSGQHPLAGKERLSLQELDGQPIILLGKDAVYNQLLQARFESLKITPRIVMHSNQITTILNFLAQGKCGCFFYKNMLPLFPSITGIPLNPAINTRIGLIWKRGRYLSQGMQEFLDFCRSSYK